MKGRMRAAGILLSVLSLGAYWLSAGQMKQPASHYKVLPPASQGNLTVFPVVSDISSDTGNLMTLEEGIRSGQVTVTEAGGTTGLVRPRPSPDGLWPERLFPSPWIQGRVNELALINKSDRPLILLAGEIVTGGKQDRVVGKDRIIPAHSDPVALGVFCVEPHRWTAMSAEFRPLQFSMAQPSVRSRAMADQNQQEVWDEVAKSRSAFAAAAPASEAQTMQSTSSYAGAFGSNALKRQIDSIAGPIEQSYEKLLGQLRAQHAVGAVVAVNNEITWADVFASSSLLERYWPKLIRSYAAEAITPHYSPAITRIPPTRDNAQDFLDILHARRENIETEPGVYRNTEIVGSDFDAFILTVLLPNTGFNVHIAKMKR
ncbi:MAG: hypothetical protein JOY54_11260 [Acidobacteriaceae bacterium]|nr:hypothetical protein [Acidobacteriaceae bacterium]